MRVVAAQGAASPILRVGQLELRGQFYFASADIKTGLSNRISQDRMVEMRNVLFCSLLLVSILSAIAQDVPTSPLDQDVIQVPEASAALQDTSEVATDTGRPVAEPAANPEPPASSQAVAPEESKIQSILPWILLAVAAALAAGLGTWAFMLRRQGIHFEALRQRVLDGGEKVPLLSEEAFALIADFRNELGNHVKTLKAETDRKLELAGETVRTAQKDALEAQQLTRDTVEHFKTSLNGQFEKIGGFMKQIAQSAAAAHEASTVTMEYSKQVGTALQNKEDEIKELRQGFQRAMLWPLVEGMVTVRDDIRKLRIAKVDDPEIGAHLAEFDKDIEGALTRLRIREFSFANGADPTEAEPHYWDAIPAAKPADTKELHGKVAQVEKVGYLIDVPGGSPIVARKALISRYAYNISIHPVSGSEGSLAAEEPGILNNAQKTQDNTNPSERL